jgi:opacity protein-like surface antigen
MHKVKHRLAVLAALATTMALVLASSVMAATVTHTILLTDESEPFYACSFPLSASITGAVRFTQVEKAEGIQLLFTPVRPTKITVTNPANGKSLTGMGQTAGEILRFSDSSFVDHLNGITLNFVLPGLGGVLQVIGNFNFADGTFSGRNTRGDTTAFCSYLADP